jgi:hypothetical protein
MTDSLGYALTTDGIGAWSTELVNDWQPWWMNDGLGGSLATDGLVDHLRLKVLGEWLTALVNDWRRWWSHNIVRGFAKSLKILQIANIQTMKNLKQSHFDRGFWAFLGQDRKVPGIELNQTQSWELK